MITSSKVNSARRCVFAACMGVALVGCSERDATAKADPPNQREWQELTVQASSYTLDPKETRPNGGGVGAFGVKLSPGDKVIAVSRDLLREGLVQGTKVRIEGLDGVYTVMDKMHRRWEEKIDILFARRKRALDWGVKTVDIEYLPPRGTQSADADASDVNRTASR